MFIIWTTNFRAIPQAQEAIAIAKRARHAIVIKAGPI